VLGAAWIADRAVLPAIAAAGNGRAVAIAGRDRERTEAMAARHGVGRVHAAYEDVLADPDVDAVYIPLVNSLHSEWSERALAAGKHVLCEKPLAMSAAEGERMAAAADAAGRLLMEAFMYRFHPRLRSQVEQARQRPIRHVSAWFGFRIAAPENYRLQPELGGGALMDVGCYALSACRWLLGEPTQVGAVARIGESGVDLTVGAALGFPEGPTAFAWGSFESPEHQALEIVFEDRTLRIEKPFTAWRDPDDPYQLMVEAFADAVLSGSPAPLPLSDSIANLRLLDRVRAAAQLGT
jgi:D-xylose 1-dehydrogenase (NADP+, D-xylono-1,5-lactone-forming)